MKQRGEGTTFDFRALLEKQNRTRLAVVLGGAAMLLLLYTPSERLSTSFDGS